MFLLALLPPEICRSKTELFCLYWSVCNHWSLTISLFKWEGKCQMCSAKWSPVTPHWNLMRAIATHASLKASLSLHLAIYILPITLWKNLEDKLRIMLGYLFLEEWAFNTTTFTCYLMLIIINKYNKCFRWSFLKLHSISYEIIYKFCWNIKGQLFASRKCTVQQSETAILSLHWMQLQLHRQYISSPSWKSTAALQLALPCMRENSWYRDTNSFSHHITANMWSNISILRWL